jgi:hypothetical protein
MSLLSINGGLSSGVTVVMVQPTGERYNNIKLAIMLRLLP